jgi:hypothetical protein
MSPVFVDAATRRWATRRRALIEFELLTLEREQRMNPFYNEETPKESGCQSGLMKEWPIDETKDGNGVPLVVSSVVIFDTGEASKRPELCRNVVCDGPASNGEADLACGEESNGRDGRDRCLEVKGSNFVAAHIQSGRPRERLIGILCILVTLDMFQIYWATESLDRHKNLHFDVDLRV